MATMGVQYYDGPLAVVALPTTGSNNFVSGDLVYMSGGLLTVSTGYTNIYAVALGNDSATANTLIPVAIILPGTRWIMQASATTAETNKGIDGPLTYTTGSVAFTPETSSTANHEWIVEELDPRDGAHTGAGGRAIGRFNTKVSLAAYV
jgi:hypothetical protein